MKKFYSKLFLGVCFVLLFANCQNEKEVVNEEIINQGIQQRNETNYHRQQEMWH